MMESEGQFGNIHLKRCCVLIDATKALVARVLFFVHSVFSVWAAACTTGNQSLWALLVIQLFFILETIHAIYKRRGREPKWISPCIALYLMTVLPPIWILNLRMFDCMKLRATTNSTCLGGYSGNGPTCSLLNIDQYLDQKTLVYTVEQVLLLLLIVGRWMLPKGTVSRDKLSMLLLVYFGMGFDIMELFMLYEERAVLLTEGIQFFILVIYSTSLFQFSLVLTNTKTKRPRLSLDPHGFKLQLVACCQSDLWAVFTNVVLQDGPFIVLRLYCLIGLGVYSYNLLFYTTKNGLVILLQCYRILVLICQCREEVEEHRYDIAESLASSSTDLRKKPQPVRIVSSSRPQLYIVDKTGKLSINPDISRDNISRDIKSDNQSIHTVDSKDLNFITTV